MTEPKLETRWLMALRGKIPQPVVVSSSLMIFNVLEAEMEGPRIKAKVLGPSGDWVQMQANGDWRLDVRLLMEADDGSPIYTTYSGILRAKPGLAERLAAGEEIAGDEMYFRSAPYFQTPSQKYGWLNSILAIGKMRSFGGGNVIYDIFEVL